MKTVPIPFPLSKNDRDRRGFPIPVIVYRDMDGTPHFTIDDTIAVDKALTKKHCGLCGKPLKVGQLWLLGGPASAFLAEGLFTAPPAHEECARYAVQVCPYLAVPNYSRLIEDRTLKPEAVHDTAQFHDNQIRPPRPLFFVLARASSIKIVDPADGSNRKYVLPRRPWKAIEFWRNSQRITQAEAEKIAAASDLPPSQLKWWPA